MTDNPSTSSGQVPSTRPVVSLPNHSGLNKNKFLKAFSLIEVIVAVAITSVILIITMQILSSAIRIESRTLVAQAMYEQVNYLIDYMSKDIRMASRGTLDGDCGRNSMEKVNIDNGEGLLIKDQRNNCMMYFLYQDTENNVYQLRAKRRDWNSTDKSWGGEYDLPLTSDDYKVTNFNYEVIPSVGNTSKDGELTKVLIGLTIESKTYKDVKLRIQTLVSTRNRD